MIRAEHTDAKCIQNICTLSPEPQEMHVLFEGIRRPRTRVSLVEDREHLRYRPAMFAPQLSDAGILCGCPREVSARKLRHGQGGEQSVAKRPNVMPVKVGSFSNCEVPKFLSCALFDHFSSLRAFSNIGEASQSYSGALVGLCSTSSWPLRCMPTLLATSR